MDGYKLYIRINAQTHVIDGYADWQEERRHPDEICILEDGPRHFQEAYGPLFDGNGQPVYKYTNAQMVDRTQDADYLLAVAKKAKLAKLDTAYNQALDTFTSSALSTPHTYLIGQDSMKRDYMTLFNAEFGRVNSAYYDGSPTTWYTVEDGNVPHTKDQFIQVYLDGYAHVGNVKYKRASYEAQINDPAITLDQLNNLSIVW